MVNFKNNTLNTLTLYIQKYLLTISTLYYQLKSIFSNHGILLTILVIIINIELILYTCPTSNSTSVRSKLRGKVQNKYFLYQLLSFFATCLSNLFAANFAKNIFKGYQCPLNSGYELYKYFFYLPHFYSNSAHHHLI